MKIYFERLGPKLPRYYMQIMLIVILLFSMAVSASAVENMWLHTLEWLSGYPSSIVYPGVRLIRHTLSENSERFELASPPMPESTGRQIIQQVVS